MRQSRHRRRPEYVNPVQEAVDALVASILDLEEGRLGRERDAIIRENQALGGTMNVFLYRGALHSSLPGFRIRDIGPIAGLHRDLHARMDRYLERRERLGRDRTRIRNALSVVGLRCRTRQELRDVLPETLVAQVPALARMARSREEGYLLAGNPVLLRQFRDMVDLVLDYQANRLLY